MINKISSIKNNHLYSRLCSNPIKPNISFGAKCEYQTGEHKQNDELKTPQSIYNYACVDVRNKISKQMQVMNKNEVQALINQVSNETDAPKELVEKACASLVQFASYSQLSQIVDEFHKHDAEALYSSSDKKEFNLNSVMEYLGSKKEQFELQTYSDSDRKRGLFVDDAFLSSLEEIKNTQDGIDYINKIKEDIDNGTLVLFALDGWDANAGGKNIAQTFLGSNMNLHDSLKTLVEQVQKGESIDEILNGETIERTKELFGNNIELNIIKNNKITDDTTAATIAKIMKPNMPTKDSIKATVDIVSQQGESCEDTAEDKALKKQLLLKYFKEMVSCFSANSLTSDMKNKYQQISEFVEKQGKTMDDVYYVLPNLNKSFELVTYQYLKTNNLGFDKVINFKDIWKNKMDMSQYEGKVFVILDDIVGTGLSLTEEEFPYYLFADAVNKNDLDINLVFAPVISLKTGIEAISDEISRLKRDEKDTIIIDNVVSYDDFIDKFCNPEEEKILKGTLGDLGYKASAACISVPYMIPDNDSFVSGLMLGKALNNYESKDANKAIDACDMELYKKIDTRKQKVKSDYKNRNKINISV